MSYEAIAEVRKRGHGGPWETKWLTVPNDNRMYAQRQFGALGFEVRGLPRVVTQEEATRMAETIARQP